MQISEETLCARVQTVKVLDLEASKTALNWTALLTASETMPLINNKRKKRPPAVAGKHITSMQLKNTKQFPLYKAFSN